MRTTFHHQLIPNYSADSTGRRDARGVQRTRSGTHVDRVKRLISTYEALTSGAAR